MNNKELEAPENPKTLERIDGTYIWREISSVLNFDKGILYTIKELLLRPGNTVREFILYDRKRLVKPIIFVIFSSLVFIILQKILDFNTGAAPQNTDSAGVTKTFQWVEENFGIFNITLGFFIGFWTRLFFLKSKYNIYEIFILVFFIIGIGNLIFTFFGIVESITGFESYGLTYLMAMSYSVWAIGSFFNKNKILSYFKGLLSYFFGTMTGSFLLVLIGILIDLFNKSG
ncbi:DUF3667 domain-containing protein [Ulvibacterium sp.]|uniref:DUF3667 domain-containing protein n=1 Tax=Ulvibacterium sp. TaxID=2665914 RepID=UPI00262C2F4F|nr:DUF3667 domain-containing protein [Ulvibacterium sp.]